MCVCETEKGMVRGRGGDISRKQSGQALCGAALGGCGGVDIVCVLRQGGGTDCSRAFVCSIFQAGGLHACSSMRTEFGFVCVNMSANLCMCACVCVCVCVSEREASSAV